MADSGTPQNGDILSLLQQQTSSLSANQALEVDLLRSIDTSLKSLVQHGNMSQSNANGSLPGYGHGYGSYTNPKQFKNLKGLTGSFKDQFTEQLQDMILDEIVGSDIREGMRKIGTKLAADIGVSLDVLPKVLAMQLGKTAIAKLRGIGPVNALMTSANTRITSTFNTMRSRYTTAMNAYNSRNGIINPNLIPNLLNPQNVNGQNGHGPNGNGPTPSNSSTNNGALTSQKLIVNAQDVYLYHQNAPQNGNPANDPNNPNNQNNPNNPQNGGNPPDINTQLRDILRQQFGAGFDADALSDDMLDEIRNSIAGGGDMNSVAEILRNRLGQGGLDSLLNTGDLQVSRNPLSELTSVITSAFNGGAGAAGALAGLKAAAMAVAPQLLAIGVAIGAITYMLKGLQEAMEHVKKAIEAYENTLDRYNKSRKEGIKTANDRLNADMHALIEQPFKILEEAAQSLYNAWDNSVRIINGTQGYTKEDLHDLIGNYADRLREENLTDVVSAADITTNLTQVLQSGLSGVVAEEFAYLATKLNAMIPTQDFFGYASTYASIAANAMQQGMDQAESISYANRQIESFAGNLLYANRELSGGFTTGLKDATQLFDQSVQIAQASKTNNASEISGVMTAVASIVGAVAPDLATGITDAVYKAAVGGNSSDIVALRSLAGINASNTEFLRQLANDPQSVFGKLFDNLGDMQNMADGAYMEVAEGLSSIFGVSMDAFARVDFNYLAQAIRNMDTTNSFLADNLDHLISGETTTNAEQMKMAQINKFMIEEGLTYVLDNEAARLVQQNMWAEQRARQIMEATYSVEIQGAALDFLEGIRTAVGHLITLYVPQLKPFDFAGKIANLFGSQTESDAFMKDLKQVLRLGKVSDGNSTAFYQLTSRNRDLHVVDDLVTLMGGTSAFLSAYNDRVEGYEKLTPWNKWWNQITNSGNAHKAARRKGIRSYEDSQYTNGIEAVLSKYSWGNIGKSISSALFGTSGGVAASVGIQDIIQSTNSVSDTAKAQQNAVENLKAMVSTMKDFAGKHSYEEWAKTANKHGISDLEAAMESAGLTEETLRGHYDSYGVQMSILEAESRKKKEEDFWDKTTELLTTTNSWLEKILNKQIDFHIDWKKFYTDWTDYFINHTAYAESYDHTSVSEIQRKEAKSSEDAVYALADALTQNDNALLDPTMQTNALLAQILKVVTAQLNQTSSGVAMSLPDTIAGLSLGIMST